MCFANFELRAQDGFQNNTTTNDVHPLFMKNMDKIRTGFFFFFLHAPNNFQPLKALLRFHLYLSSKIQINSSMHNLFTTQESSKEERRYYQAKNKLTTNHIHPMSTRQKERKDYTHK